MIRVLALSLVFPVSALAQTAAPADSARARGFDAPPSGYADIRPDDHGTPADPAPTELGALLVMRMFQTVCLGLERRAELGAVLPRGFAAFAAGPYLFAEAVPAADGDLVLSPTGNIDADEAAGHPTVLLTVAETGMDCRVEWLPRGEATRLDAIPGLVQAWFPWELALIRVSRPPVAAWPMTDLVEWDRPCNGRWCRVEASYALEGARPRLSLSTTLDITGIGGKRP